jgi:hypothetical protein
MFIKKLFSSIIFCFLSASIMAASKGDFYQIKIYHLANQNQEEVVDEYLKTAYLPAMHRAGVTKIGVFKPVPNSNKDAERLIYVFIPFKSSKDFFKIEKKLEVDNKHQLDGKNYLDASYKKPPYVRLESILLTAFEKSLNFKLPQLNSPKKDRIYELRSYEGHTEKISKNKIKMFNDGDEIGLFKRLGFNAVFYGEVIAGSKMPNLMYLTTFKNKADRDQHWNDFGKDEEWKKLSADPQYQNNVSKNDTKLLYPTDYSDI